MPALLVTRNKRVSFNERRVGAACGPPLRRRPCFRLLRRRLSLSRLLPLLSSVHPNFIISNKLAWARLSGSSLEPPTRTPMSRPRRTSRMQPQFRRRSLLFLLSRLLLLLLFRAPFLSRNSLPRRLWLPFLFREFQLHRRLLRLPLFQLSRCRPSQPLLHFVLR